MTGCCGARGYEKLFSARAARRAAAKYRKRGLDETGKRMVEFLASQGIEGASVLEIGGGVGEVAIELLKRGAERAVNLELSPAYEEEAKRLLRDEALAERGEWRLHDIAADPEPIEPADLVVLHRVVCCYPDYRRLLGAAAERSRRLVVFSHPPRHALSRLFVAGQNLVFRLLRMEFRAFVHPPAAMQAVVAERRFRLVFAHRALVWHIAAFERE
jgi:SAM-dependent methyltransferase